MNSYQQQQEFEQQERMSSRQYIFENPLLPSPVISPATVYPSSDRQQQWNTQQQYDDHHSAQPDSQPSYSDPQQSTYAQAYTLEQHYQASPYDNSYYQSHQSFAYPYHSQSGHAHNDHYANPPVVAKVSQFSSLSGALDEPVLQHPRPSYSVSSYSSLIANVDYSRQQSSWSQEAQYQTHRGDSRITREHSSSNANELPPPSYPQMDYNVQEPATISYSAETDTSYYQPQLMAERSIYINHQPDHPQSYHYLSQTSYVQPSNQMSSYSYQEPAGASQAAYTIPQSMLPPSQTGPRHQFAVPPAIVPTQQRATTPPPPVEDSPSASPTASPINTVLSDRTLPIRKASITSAASIKQEEPLSCPSPIVKSSLVRSASLLHVDVGQASLDSPTSHRARQERRKAQSRNSSAPYPPTSVDMGQGHKIPTSVSLSTTSPSTQPLVISVTERKPITTPEYMPASSSATSAASSSASGQHQVIAISGTPEPGQESPKILEGESGESSPNGGKSSKAIQLDENGEKKPFLACGFCRHRKIACGQGPVWENDDQLPPGPRTCNQCFRRCLECFYPTESRRGLRKGKPSRKIVYDINDGSVSWVPGEEGAVIEGSPGGDTITVEKEDGTTKKKGNGKAKKNWKDFICDMIPAVDADWVLARR
ncbi:hypothetical protein FRC02_009939 [Tulasnella sp. 418]|nr:hypothetical protein FRC02_009939 [Tulasnella sp. 418]